MMNRKLFLMIVVMMVCLTSCSASSEPKEEINDTEILAISELAVIDCYYHNVAKFHEEDASGILFWTKDKEFWIEYSGIVSIGIDAAEIEIKVEGENVEITLPHAEVLSSKVDEATLSEDSFYIADGSAAISADDQTFAFAQAQERMVSTAKEDTSLIIEAENRVESLLTDYINKIAASKGVEYKITWIYQEEIVEEE